VLSLQVILWGQFISLSFASHLASVASSLFLAFQDEIKQFVSPELPEFIIVSLGPWIDGWME
jgi:hypothetical protein